MKARATASSSFPSMLESPLTSHTWKQRSNTNSRARTSSALNDGEDDDDDVDKADDAAAAAAPPVDGDDSDMEREGRVDADKGREEVEKLSRNG